METGAVKMAVFAAILGIAQGVVITNYSSGEAEKTYFEEKLVSMNATLKVNTAAVINNTQQLKRMEESERDSIGVLASYKAKLEEHEKRLDKAGI
jgi:negative regulator of sigma E activity